MPKFANLRGSLRNSFHFSVLVCCILVTGLNQYVTYNNASVWLSGRRALQQEYQNLHVFLQMQEAYAHATETMRHLAVVANSEKVRAEKAEYDLQRAKDEIRRQKMFGEQLAKYANYLVGLLSQLEQCPMTFEEFLKAGQPTPVKPAG